MHAEAPHRIGHPPVVRRYHQRTAQIELPDALSDPANEGLTGEETKGLVVEARASEAGWYHAQDVHSRS